MSNLIFVFILSFFLLSTQLCNDISTDKATKLKSEESKVINALAGANMTSLLIEAGRGSDSELKFGSKSNYYAFTTRGQYNDLIISSVQRPIIQADSENNLMIFTDTLSAQAGLSYTGNLKIRDTPQWKMVLEEDFSGNAEGWTNNVVTECGGVRMLGGYCKFGGGEIFKVFSDLPPHTNIRIQATFHFIDAWDTESGFMRINNGKDGEMQYAWIGRYSAFTGNNGINICGGPWPEGKFASPIDVTIPHKASSIKLGFGATIEQDPCDESFGVSGIRIYIK